MDSFPSILDDEQIRDKIAKAIEEAQKIPFSAALEKWIEKKWKLKARVGPWQPSVFSLMARKEDVGIIQGLAEKYKRPVEAFYLYWDAGLFDEARALIENHKEVRDKVGVEYTDQDGCIFEMCAGLAKWGVWGRCQEMLQFMAAIHGVGRSIRHGLQGRVAHQLLGYKTLVFTGPRGTEKPLIARAVHGLSERDHFEAIDCSQLTEGPQGIIERCQYRGTVFLEHFDQLPSRLRSPLLQTINQGRLLKTVRGADGEIVERQSLDTLFILGMDSKYPAITGYLADESVIGTTGLVKPVPPLERRIEDIPLWVNQYLLTYEETQLDNARHLVAATLKEYYEAQRPTREVGGLLKNVTGLVIEFSPETTLHEEDGGVSKEEEFSLDDGSSIAWLRGREYGLTAQQFKVVNALWEAPTHSLGEGYILKGVLENPNPNARLRDTFRSRPGYYSAEGKQGVETALLVGVSGTRPLRVRLNIRKP